MATLPETFHNPFSTEIDGLSNAGIQLTKLGLSLVRLTVDRSTSVGINLDEPTWYSVSQGVGALQIVGDGISRRPRILGKGLHGTLHPEFNAAFSTHNESPLVIIMTPLASLSDSVDDHKGICND